MTVSFDNGGLQSTVIRTPDNDQCYDNCESFVPFSCLSSLYKLKTNEMVEMKRIMQ